MTNPLFKRKLKKVLDRGLPRSNEYVRSNRVEIAYVPSEESTHHEKGAVIIDDELTEEQSKQLGEVLTDYLSHDSNFKKTKYKTMLWKESSFVNIKEHGSFTLCSIKGLKKDVNSVITSGTTSGDWENFRELCRPYRNKGQLFLLTTQEKVDLLDQARAMSIRNLVIIYPHTDEKGRKALINNIPCIPYED